MKIVKVLLTVFLVFSLISRSFFLIEFLKGEFLYIVYSDGEILIRSAEFPIAYSDALQPYDRLLSIDNLTFKNSDEAASYVLNNADEKMEFTIKRGHEIQEIAVTPISSNETDFFGFRFTNDRHMYGLVLPQSDSNFWIFKNYSFNFLIVEIIFITFCFWKLVKNQKVGYYFSFLYLLFAMSQVF